MFIQLNGQIINYEHTGTGRPLILLHGNGEDHRIFDELTAALPEFSVYAIDTRGHGESAVPKEYHYRDMASDLVAFVHSLEIMRPLVVGYSDGAVTALIAAAREPALFSGIISCGANMTPKGLTRKALKEITRAARQTGDPKIVMMTREPDITSAELSRIAVPVLVLAGEHDLIREKETRAIASAIPGSGVMILPGEDHGSYVVHSPKLAGYIRTFASNYG